MNKSTKLGRAAEWLLQEGGATCVEHGRGEGAGGRGSVGPAHGERHAAVYLHGEGVVEVRLQVADRHPGLGQPGAGRLVADLVPAGQAQRALAALALHAVGEVRAAASLLRGAPGEEQLPAAAGGHQVPGSRGESWWGGG